MSVMPCRRGRVLSEQVGADLLLLDERSNVAYALGPSAARVWDRCDGVGQVDDVARGLGLDRAQIEGILDTLDDLGVLSRGTTRRQVLQRGALVSGGVLVASALVPMASAAGSSGLPPRTSFYAGDSSSSGVLYAIATSNGVASVVTTLPVGIFDLAVDPGTRQLYIEDVNRRIYAYNATTKTLGPVIATLPALSGLGVGPNGLIYALDLNSANAPLVTVNPATGRVSTLGLTGIALNGGDLTVDLAGTVYVVTGSTASLYRIPAGATKGVLVGALHRGTVDALAYVNGLLYAANLNNRVFTINPGNAATTVIGTSAPTLGSAG